MKVNQHKILFIIPLFLFCFIQQSCSQRNLKKTKAESPAITEEKTKIEIADDYIELVEEGQQNSLISIELMDELDIIKNEEAEPIVKTNPSSKTTPQIAKKENELKDRKEENSGKNKGLVPSPPAKTFRVRLKIQNKNEQPMWYLMPYKGHNVLEASGLFKTLSTIPEEEILQSYRFAGSAENTSLIEVRYEGREGHHFRAFYIPAQSSFTLSNYVIDCWQDSDKVELWAVKELLVNNQKSAAEWLPYSVLSSPDVVIRCDPEEGCPSEKIEGDNAIQAGANGKRIEFIQANKVNKYSVQLQHN
jgi:hypothetical protein